MTDYSTLPDGIDANALSPYFHEVATRRVARPDELQDALEELVELSNRQWHTREALAPALKEEICVWLEAGERIWERTAEGAEAVLAVSLQLGLQRIAANLAKMSASSSYPEVRDVLDLEDWGCELDEVEDASARARAELGDK